LASVSLMAAAAASKAVSFSAAAFSAIAASFQI
jgi:hypothetical protein